MSLLSQLAELSNPAPLLSPTSSRASTPASDGDAGAGSGSDVEAGTANVGREHYVDVAPSARRKKTLDESGTLRSGKYKGREISAKEALLLGQTGESDEEEEDDEDEDQLDRMDEDSDDDDEEGEEDSDDEDGEDPATPPPSDALPSRVLKSLRFASPSPTSAAAADDGTLASAAASDAALLATLRARTADDAARGLAVRSIRGAWEQALGVRIRAQGFVRGAGRIQPASLEALPTEARSTHAQILAQLDALTYDFFNVRAALHASDEIESEAYVRVIDTLKRKRSSSEASDSQHATSLNAFLELHATTRARALDVLDAWSVGPQSASSSSTPGGGKSAASALRAVNTGAGAQVRTALSGEGVERLVKRARTWRGEKRLGLEEVDDEQDEGEKEEDMQTFDDSDFYATLLRELIESKGDVGSADATLALPQRSAAPKRAVDTRASKGRRIRYEVHEKIANFMPPVPRETWSDVQRERLFRQLAGAAVGGDAEGEKEKEVEEVELDGLKVFG